MIKTLGDLVREVQQRGDLARLTISPLLQFGTEDDPYLGAELLPEITRRQNQYTEMEIRYQTLIANAGSHYSPAQLNPGGRITGEFDVKFGKVDQADTMTVQDYEDIMDLLELSNDATNNRDLRAIMRLLNWFDVNIVRPVIELNEKYRWDMIVDAQVLRTGSNGYRELVIYPNPAGHRIAIPSGTVAAPTGWFGNDPAYDPFTDFLAIKRAAAAKGYRITRIISDFEAAYLYMNHPGTRQRFFGLAWVQGTNQITPIQRSVNMDDINGELRKNGLPAWEVYDRTYNYRAADGSIAYSRFLERQTFHPIIIVCNTQRSQEIDLGDQPTIILQNTLGYFGIGRMPGRPAPGRITNQKIVEDQYPESLYAECLQMGLPVNTSPEAMYVMKIMKPTP